MSCLYIKLDLDGNIQSAVKTRRNEGLTLPIRKFATSDYVLIFWDRKTFSFLKSRNSNPHRLCPAPYLPPHEYTGEHHDPDGANWPIYRFTDVDNYKALIMLMFKTETIQ